MEINRVMPGPQLKACCLSEGLVALAAFVAIAFAILFGGIGFNSTDHVPYRTVHTGLRRHGGGSAYEDHNQQQEKEENLSAYFEYRIGSGKIKRILFCGTHVY